MPIECSRLCISIFFKFFSQIILLQPSSFYKYNTVRKLATENSQTDSKDNNLPDGIVLYASFSIGPSARPVVGPSWGLTGLWPGRLPTQLRAALWLLALNKGVIKQVRAKMEEAGSPGSSLEISEDTFFTSPLEKRISHIHL